jgi:hypothetical protein
MTNAYFIRNEQTDADGRMAKWDFKPNWREAMAAGEDTKRGYVAGDKLVLVNDKPEVFNADENENLTDIEISEAMFSPMFTLNFAVRMTSRNFWSKRARNGSTSRIQISASSLACKSVSFLTTVRLAVGLRRTTFLASIPKFSKEGGTIRLWQTALISVKCSV